MSDLKITHAGTVQTQDRQGPVSPALSKTVSSKNVIATNTPFKHVTALVPVTNIEPACPN